jgi:tetratricopeptide (TPR) repeat protein
MHSHTNFWSYCSESRLPSLVCALSLAWMSNSAIGRPTNITQGETAMSPPYCIYKDGFEDSQASGQFSPGAKHWQSILGDGFRTLHHYCWAHVSMQRAMRHDTTPGAREHYLSDAAADDWFVIQNTKSDFILLPEIYTHLGKLQLMRSRPQEANKAFAQARALKPDYWPAYSHWAEFLIRAGQRAEAKQVVKSGLEYSPKAKVLQEQYRLLGGNPAEIVPKVKAIQAAESVDDSSIPPIIEEPEADPTPVGAPPAATTDR